MMAQDSGQLQYPFGEWAPLCFRITGTTIPFDWHAHLGGKCDRIFETLRFRDTGLRKTDERKVEDGLTVSQCRRRSRN